MTAEDRRDLPAAGAARRRFQPKVPDHDRTQRILSMVGELLREPAYDQLRVGQLLEVVRPVPGPDLFFIEDAALESALAAKLEEVRAGRPAPGDATAGGPKP